MTKELAVLGQSLLRLCVTCASHDAAGKVLTILCGSWSFEECFSSATKLQPWPCTSKDLSGNGGSELSSSSSQRSTEAALFGHFLEAPTQCSQSKTLIIQVQCTMQPEDATQSADHQLCAASRTMYMQHYFSESSEALQQRPCVLCVVRTGHEAAMCALQKNADLRRHNPAAWDGTACCTRLCLTFHVSHAADLPACVATSFNRRWSSPCAHEANATSSLLTPGTVVQSFHCNARRGVRQPKCHIVILYMCIPRKPASHEATVQMMSCERKDGGGNHGIL